MNKQTEIPDWERLLAHAALLQSKIPAAILVGVAGQTPLRDTAIDFG